MTTFLFKTKTNDVFSGRKRWNDFPFLLDKTNCLTKLHHTHILSSKYLVWFLSYHASERFIAKILLPEDGPVWLKHVVKK
jgi:hypothetical protein